MMEVPALTADTTPVPAIIVATNGLALVQVPPPSPSLVYVSDDKIQSGDATLRLPAFTSGSTVKVKEDEAPQPTKV